MLRIVRGIKRFYSKCPFDKAVRPRALRVSLSETLRERQLRDCRLTRSTHCTHRLTAQAVGTRRGLLAMGMPTKRGNAHQEKKMIYELKNGIETIHSDS